MWTATCPVQWTKIHDHSGWLEGVWKEFMRWNDIDGGKWFLSCVKATGPVSFQVKLATV